MAKAAGAAHDGEDGQHRAMEEASISKFSGSSVEPGVSKAPARAASPAPPPIMMAPPRPEAVRARSGRTDRMPALAEGKPIPSPMVTWPIIEAASSSDIISRITARESAMRQIRKVVTSGASKVPSVAKRNRIRAARITLRRP